MSDQPENRLGALDGLRAISILLVLSTHMLPLGPKAWQLNQTAGSMGMSLFFALSGFLITRNLVAGQTTADFFIRRFMRILPLAYLYLAIVFLIVTYDPVRLAGNLVFIENYQFKFLNDLNGHFWSLCVEMHFYLAIGMAVFILGRRGIFLVLPACLLITSIRISQGTYTSIETHLRVDEILAGASVAILSHWRALDFRINQFWLLVPLSFWFLSSHPDTGILQYARPYFSAGVLALTLMLAPGQATACLKSRIAKYIAEISYALYVLHPLTTHGSMNEGNVWERYFIKRPVSFLMTFFLAHLSTFYYERRWIQLGKRATQRWGRSAVVIGE
jgi:peptidoglycan/LPS O-acetylase OafA/YrhL